MQGAYLAPSSTRASCRRAAHVSVTCRITHNPPTHEQHGANLGRPNPGVGCDVPDDLAEVKREVQCIRGLLVDTKSNTGHSVHRERHNQDNDLDNGHPIAEVRPARWEGEGREGRGVKMETDAAGVHPPMVKEQVDGVLALSGVAGQAIPQEQPSQSLMFQDVVPTTWMPHLGVAPARLALALLLLPAEALWSQPRKAAPSHDHHMTIT